MNDFRDVKCILFILLVNKYCSITIYHNIWIILVMLVEIPDIEIILGVIIAFVIGLVGLYVYHKVYSLVKIRNENNELSQLERLEYYEKQLIDMKIRLDSMEMQYSGEKRVDLDFDLKQFLQKLDLNQHNEQKSDKDVVKDIIVEEKFPIQPNLESNNSTDHVLHLITNRAMTSRDIQITLKRSREHTSRLMKKLFEDGYVQRNINTKPYTYSITKKGIEKIKLTKSNSTVA